MRRDFSTRFYEGAFASVVAQHGYCPCVQRDARNGRKRTLNKTGWKIPDVLN